MSIRWMAEVFEIAGLSESDGWLLMAIADHADDDGLAYPSVARLAHKTGWSTRTVQRGIRRFEDRGLLVKVADAQAQRARKYRLVFAGLARKLAFKSPLTPDTIVSPVTELCHPCQKGHFQPERGDTHVSPEPSVKRTIRKKERARETEWPDDFLLTAERAAAATTAGCRNPPLAWRAWQQRCLAKGLRYVRWGAAWATWLSNHGRFGCPCQGATRAGKPSVRDLARDIAAEWAAEENP